jgi:hypothetical protein
LVVLHQTLSDLHDIPARHLRALEERLAELETSSTDTAALSPYCMTCFFTNRRNVDQIGIQHLNNHPME